MNNVNVNKDPNFKILKNCIKDLSFENPQNIDENFVINKDNTNLNVNVNVFYKPYDNKSFSFMVSPSLVLSFFPSLPCTSPKGT